MRKSTLLFFLYLACQSVHAQNPAQLLDAWGAKSPIEKVYLHTDRDNYIAGETAWFKAYLLSDYLPDTISTSLYTELVNNKGVILGRSVTPILAGNSSGFLDIPETLSGGVYSFRAYTPTMLNQGESFIYKRSIYIYGKRDKSMLPENEKKTIVEFFPEGGNMVTGLNGSVAFKITNEEGLPKTAAGKIFTDKGVQVAEFNAYHDGMGSFELSPSVNETYYAVLNGETPVIKYYLPAPVAKGISLTVIPHPQGSFFEIKQLKEDPAFQVAYMIGQMQHHVVFRQDFKGFKEEMQGVINTQKLHSGILQITFFNKEHQPLAERLCFVDNKEYQLSGELLPDTLSFAEKGRNRISVRLKDTVQGNFSVSVTDAGYLLNSQREQNIYTTLLLTSDIKGYVHNPAQYFVSADDSVKLALDLVMMTNGWRRFRWEELSAKKDGNFRDPAFITLSGKVTLRDTKKPFAAKQLLLMLITADSTRRIQMINTDKDGKFRVDSMLFFGRSKIIVSDIRGKKNMYIDVYFDEDSLTRKFIQGITVIPPLLIPSSPQLENNSATDQYFDAIKRAKGLLLEGVTVKAKKKTPIQELEEQYARGMFSGGDNRTFDLVNNNDAQPYQNIFEFLQARVPGLMVQDNNASAEMTSNDGSASSITIYYRQGHASLSSMGPIPMTLYLNEVETDASVIATLPTSGIAMVKVYSSFVGAAGNGAGGVLAIYTKNDIDLTKGFDSRADMERYSGYTVIKEFYEPNYKDDPASKSREDNRITLAWRPDILVNNLNPRIPVSFYNNDKATQFRIVIEGMTLDGKMLMIEKLVGPKGF